MDKKKLFLICLFLGFFGGHYFAIGKYKRGLLYFFTVGLFGIGWLIDLIKIATTQDFAAYLQEQEAAAAEQKEEAVKKQALDEAKLEGYRANGTPFCPVCHSTSLTANKKGFSLGKAAVGSAIVFPLGLATGMVGKNKIYLTCMNCGCRFKPGRR